MYMVQEINRLIVKVKWAHTSNIKIHPNPTSDFINFEVNNLELSSVSIFNILGKNVLNQNKIINNRINISNLNQGVYFVKLIVQNKSIVKRIIVE